MTRSRPEDLIGQTDGCAQPRWHFSSFLCFLRYYCHTVLEHVSPLCTATKMPAEATGGSAPTHVRTRTFQRSSTHLRGRGQTRHWTHAPGDIWGNIHLLWQCSLYSWLLLCCCFILQWKLVLVTNGDEMGDVTEGPYMYRKTNGGSDYLSLSLYPPTSTHFVSDHERHQKRNPVHVPDTEQNDFSCEWHWPHCHGVCHLQHGGARGERPDGSQRHMGRASSRHGWEDRWGHPDFSVNSYKDTLISNHLGGCMYNGRMTLDSLGSNYWSGATVADDQFYGTVRKRHNVAKLILQNQLISFEKILCDGIWCFDPTGARVNTIVVTPGGFFTNAEIEQVSPAARSLTFCPYCLACLITVLFHHRPCPNTDQWCSSSPMESLLLESCTL